MVVVAATAGAYYVSSGSKASNSAPSNIVNISIQGGVGNGTVDQYIPSTFTVKEGQSITLAVLNTDDNTHGLAIKAFGVDTGKIPAGHTQRVTFIANQTGTFLYYEPPGYCTAGVGGRCNSVQHMIGNMTVIP